MTQPEKDACPACLARDRYIRALEKQVAALGIALTNSARSLAAEGRSLRKARSEAEEARKGLGQ